MRKLCLAGVSLLALGASNATAEEANTNQFGNNGEAYINQANTTTDAVATITQGIEGAGNSSNDIAATYQTGSGIFSATIDQNTGGAGGGDNQAGIVQSDGLDTGGSAAGPGAIITQNGSNNTGGVRQQGVGNTGEITQTGDFNQAVVKQGDQLNENFDRLGLTTPSSGPIWQALNFSFPIIGGSSFDTPPGGIIGFPDLGAEATAENSLGTVDQTGNGNKAAILQTAGIDHIATVNQLGDGNESRVLQAGTSQFADVEQTGNGNGADVQQQDGGLLGGGDHEARILQEGNDDLTRVFQTGDSNSADVYQEDDGVTSVAIVTQSGGDNISVINQ